MIRGLSYDDRRLRDLPGEPLLATMVESAARCCGMGLIYEFWGVYEGLRDRTPKGVILQKGHALWASAFCPEAAAEIVDFLQWRQEGWVMLCPTLAALWREKTGEAGLPLAVMELPEGVGFSLPEAEYRTHTATAAAGCNRAVGEVSPAQYEAAVVNLHLAERRRVGHTVTLERDGGDRLRHPVRADQLCGDAARIRGTGLWPGGGVPLRRVAAGKEPHPSGGL